MLTDGQKNIDIKLERLAITLILKTITKFGSFFATGPELMIMKKTQTLIHNQDVSNKNSKGESMEPLSKGMNINIEIKDIVIMLPSGPRALRFCVLFIPNMVIHRRTYQEYQNKLLETIIQDYKKYDEAWLISDKDDCKHKFT